MVKRVIIKNKDKTKFTKHCNIHITEQYACFHDIKVGIKCRAFEEITLQLVSNSPIHALGRYVKWHIIGQVVNYASVFSYAWLLKWYQTIYQPSWDFKSMLEHMILLKYFCVVCMCGVLVLMLAANINSAYIKNHIYIVEKCSVKYYIVAKYSVIYSQYFYMQQSKL